MEEASAENAYTPYTVARTLMPLKRAASGLLPSAKTFLPKRVRVVITTDSAMTTSQTKNSEGIQRMSIWAKCRKGLGRPAIIRASEISMRSPRTAVIMPNVAMKGGTRPSWISTPLRTPSDAPAARATRMEGMMGTPWVMSTATRTLLNPTIEPTERSMPAEMMTMVIPMATTPMIATCRTRFERLLSVRKLGDVKERMTKKASRMRIRIPSAKPVRKNFTTLEGRRAQEFDRSEAFLEVLTVSLPCRCPQCPRPGAGFFLLRIRFAGESPSHSLHKQRLSGRRGP